MEQPTSENWSVKLTRNVEYWDWEFKEHWTYKVRDGELKYKLRVVGPNGEVARTEMEKDNAPRDVRASFEDTFREAATDA